MSTSPRPVLPAALVLLGASISCCATADAQDLADRQFQLTVPRTALTEYWAAQRQEQLNLARYRSSAQFGQYGLRYGAQSSLGYRAIGPRQFYGPALPTSSGFSDAAMNYCVGPLGIECSPLDCDCDPLDSCY